MRPNRPAVLVLALVLATCGSGAVDSPTSPAATPSAAAPTAGLSASTLSPEPVAQTPSPSGAEITSPPASALGVVLIPFANRQMELLIVGEPGVVVAWRAASDRELDAVTWTADGDIALGRLSDRELVLDWVGTVCDVEATLTVAPGSLVVNPVPRKGCDAMAVGRGVVLTFADPVDPASIAIVLEPTVLFPEES